MANVGDGNAKGKDFYEVLGLDRECTASDLKTAYKKLALRWHPDRCSSSGNSMYIEEAKIKFQAIQRAYSVLSDGNKRLLYDFGIYDSDDEADKSGMGDFLSEMAVMMRQTKPSENGAETFEQLQELFEEMLQPELVSSNSSYVSTSSYAGPSSFFSFGGCENPTVPPIPMSSTNNSGNFNFETHKFCVGVEHHQQFKKGEGRRKPYGPCCPRRCDKSSSKSRNRG